MMDFFGIGSAMQGMALTYFQAARASGRTTSMIKFLEDGDRVVFTNQQECRRVKRLFDEVGKDVECIVIEPKQVDRLFERGPSWVRTVFDHTWVEKYYLNALRQIQADLTVFENENSDKREPQRLSDRAVMERRKWEI